MNRNAISKEYSELATRAMSYGGEIHTRLVSEVERDNRGTHQAKAALAWETVADAFRAVGRPYAR